MNLALQGSCPGGRGDGGALRAVLWKSGHEVQTASNQPKPKPVLLVPGMGRESGPFI